MTFREIENILQANNWLLIRVMGSSHQYRKVGCPHAIVVSDHQSRPLSTSLIKDLEKKTGLSLSR